MHSAFIYISTCRNLEKFSSTPPPKDSDKSFGDITEIRQFVNYFSHTWFWLYKSEKFYLDIFHK